MRLVPIVDGGHIATIIQGRFDAICAPEFAWQLHKALPNSKMYFCRDSAHSAGVSTGEGRGDLLSADCDTGPWYQEEADGGMQRVRQGRLLRQFQDEDATLRETKPCFNDQSVKRPY